MRALPYEGFGLVVVCKVGDDKSGGGIDGAELRVLTTKNKLENTEQRVPGDEEQGKTNLRFELGSVFGNM